MSDTDRTGALKRKVVDTVSGDQRFTQTFAPYWNLFVAATEDVKIRSFYIRVDESASFYSASINALEVAAICDGLVINLKVDGRNYYGGSGRTLTVKPLSAIGGIRLHPGSVQNLQDTQNALLTVMTDDAALYWFAKTEDERGYLIDFAQDLMRKIAAR